jgi:hypothetical protein
MKLASPALSLLAALMLAACSEPAPPAQPATDDASATSPAPPEQSGDTAPDPAAAEVDTCVGARVLAILPDQVCLPEGIAQVGDNRYTDAQGRERARIVLTYRDMLQSVASDSFAERFAARGYRIREAKSDASGTLSRPMTRDDRGTVYLVVGPGAASQGKGEGGQLYVDFVLPAR